MGRDKMEEKMITRKLSMVLLCCFTLCTFITHVDASEAMVDPVKEAKIKQLNNLTTEDVFQNLKREDFFYDDEFLKKGINRAFKNRKKEVVRLALSHLKTGQKTRDGRRSKKFPCCKKNTADVS